MGSRAGTLGSFIKRLRRSRRVTQRQLAAAAGVSQPMYCYIEKGTSTPTEHQLKGIAGLLGCDLRYLIRLMPDDARNGHERGHLDESADQAAARELGKVFACGSCGSRPTKGSSRALVDALAELRALAATAGGVGPGDALTLASLWKDAQGRLDLIAALVDARANEGRYGA